MAPPRQAVKISDKTHAELKRLTVFAARNGWSGLGFERDDLPTQTALIEEAIILLGQRASDKPRSKR
jgi:hypothetical protein